jgi:hypothetical protein
MKYYIYHIEGIKIGCTTNPKKRVKEQGYTEYSILETHDDINTASDREIELQKECGYPIDKIPYYISIKNIDKAKDKIDYYKTGKRLGKWAVDSGHLSTICKFGGKATGLMNTQNGHMDRMRAAGNFNRKSIVGYNRFTNQMIGEWNSLIECANELELKVPKISECINGKRKYHKDYIFNYKA